MRRLLVGLFTLVAALHAADVTGTWKGTVTFKNGDNTREDAAYLTLKQTGTSVTGKLGPNAENGRDISKGSVNGNDIVLEAPVQGENKLVLRLKLDGDKLAGDIKAEGPNAPPIDGKITVTKEK